MVGDTPRDMEATNQAGATAVGVATGHYLTERLKCAQTVMGPPVAGISADI
jgi:phosphoglycolate phosphatase-like HAD superfamily hydrolase